MGFSRELERLFDGAARYQISAATGAIAAGAGTNIIFYMRNSSTSMLAMIEHVKINGHVATTAYAAGQVLYQLNVARGFSAENGTPHGTALTITGMNQKLADSFPTSRMGVIRVTDTTAGGLGAPTWTLDSNPVGQLNSHSSAGWSAATPIIGNQYLPNNGELFRADPDDGEYPIVLGVNEGIGIRVTVPATGVAIHGITVKWAETDRA